MHTKIPAVLAFLGLTSNVLAAPAAQAAPVDARAQPWRGFKREAVAAESPELAHTNARESEFITGSQDRGFLKAVWKLFA
ncbi:hypothetical protein B0H67DRAFT_645258 [Lasiosphaeris hirsuta]|uniref:Uncharacterized protein n=1 Tax=Lasiosphaeris hirsuta TaxID=260670 RepID=A0AA40DTE6_9PEZI|nr:hypothetical protein B0H67DRAFT_645258 [Lasiosphaeris hirsuta]